LIIKSFDHKSDNRETRVNPYQIKREAGFTPFYTLVVEEREKKKKEDKRRSLWKVKGRPKKNSRTGRSESGAFREAGGMGPVIFVSQGERWIR
jgi:neutral trehalase